MRRKDKEQFSFFGTVPLEQVLPAGHPLRHIRSIFDEVWAELAPGYEGRYSLVRAPEIPPQVLLAWLLKSLYSIESDGALCE